ncbi:hypothetical protein GQ607_007977 [Colletotrichum asianum]|uniref:Uncharacterized protein n=1 Tax=Colletotrichum asianum TaxID=702518 RepID=A0A8H3ZSN0_9PEZI|nr:hypothetical protein GQ607_007977 [Colletotrichum asianum]
MDRRSGGPIATKPADQLNWPLDRRFLSPSRTSAHRAHRPLHEKAWLHRIDLGNLVITIGFLIRLLQACLRLASIESKAVLTESVSFGSALADYKSCSSEAINLTHNLVSYPQYRTPWMCLELSRIAHSVSPRCPSFEETPVFSAEGSIKGLEPEYSQRGPKRKQILLWQCCQCGQGGNPIRHDNCYNCHYPRCAYCPVRKVRA